MAELGELLDRVRVVLTKLELLAEGQTAELDADRVAHSSSESRPPAQVDSLREKYLRRLEGLCHAAEADLARFKFPAPRNQQETDDQFAERVISKWHGHHVDFVSDMEGQSRRVIERVRKAFGRDPTFGLPRRELS